jgi:glycine/sarcosine N-methyltransferase
MSDPAGHAMAADYHDLAECYSLLFPLNDRQREFFAHLRAAAPVESVLDVGCGTGEHLSWFSEQGVRGYGLEPDESMFRELGRRRWPGAVPALAPSGVEALPAAVAERVDLVLCLGNTLAHLPDRAAVRQAVGRMVATLAPRGRVVLQTVNFDRILAEGRAAFPVIERTAPGGGRIAFFREYDMTGLPERIMFKTRLVTPAGERSAAWPLLPLRKDEVAQHLRKAGVPAIRAFGDYTRIPFAPDSPALVLLGETG